MAEDLKKSNIPCTVILDAAVGVVMERVDFVLLGGEGVVESGGIINKIGTASMCLCAKMLNKPVYAAVESFKFVRFYPLNNSDIPDEFKVNTNIFRDSAFTSILNYAAYMDPLLPIFCFFTSILSFHKIEVI
jgi:translation initiation factor eIF-2B subunit alpha